MKIKVDHLGVDGTEQADVLTSSRHPEIINGSKGLDTVVFGGNYEDYNIFQRSKHSIYKRLANFHDLEVTDTRYRYADEFDGDDTLKNIERLKFADKEAVVTSNNVLPIHSLDQKSKAYSSNSYDLSLIHI